MPTIPLIFRYDRRRPRPRRRPPCRRVRRRSFDLAAAVALAAAAPLNRGTEKSCCVFCRGLWLRGFFRGTPSPEYTSYTLGRMVGGRMVQGRMVWGVYRSVWSRSVWSRGVWSEVYTGAYGPGAYALGAYALGRMLWGVCSGGVCSGAYCSQLGKIQKIDARRCGGGAYAGRQQSIRSPYAHHTAYTSVWEDHTRVW